GLDFRFPMVLADLIGRGTVIGEPSDLPPERMRLGPFTPGVIVGVAGVGTSSPVERVYHDLPSRTHRSANSCRSPFWSVQLVLAMAKSRPSYSLFGSPKCSAEILTSRIRTRPTSWRKRASADSYWSRVTVLGFSSNRGSISSWQSLNSRLFSRV